MSRLAELYAQAGRQRAESERARGERSAALIQNLGAIAANTANSIGQYYADAPRREAEQMQLEALRSQRTAAEQDAQVDANLRSLFSTGQMPTPEQLIQVAGPDRGSKIATGLAAIRELHQKEAADHRGALGRLALGIQALPESLQQTVWPQIRQMAHDSGLGIADAIPETPNADFLNAVIAEATGQAPKAKEGYTLTPGSQRFDENNMPVASVPFSPDKLTFSAPTAAMLNGKRVFVRTGSDGKTYDLKGNVLDAEPTPIPPSNERERIVQVMGPDGTPIWVRESEAVGKPAAQAPRAVTGAERQALSFYNRAKDAVQTLTAVDQSGVSLEDRVAKSGLASQTRLKYAPNFALSDDEQAYNQAQRAFTEARLRKESGAAIPESEFENDRKTYFAQPGDSKATIDQKRQKREKLLEGLGYAAGRAYEEFYGEPMPKTGTTASASPSPAVPSNVSAALKGQPAGRYTLSDGSVWVIGPDGSITKGGA